MTKWTKMNVQGMGKRYITSEIREGVGWANHLLVDSLNESTNLDQEHKKHQAKKNSKDELCV